MTATGELLEVAEAIVVKPSDTLIIRVAPGISQDSAHRLRAMIKERLPDLKDIAVIAAEQIAVYRLDETEEAEVAHLP